MPVRSVGGRGDGDSRLLGELPHRDLGGVDEAGRSRSDRDRLERPVLAVDRLALSRDAEPVRHHDQEPVLVDELQLGAQEARVGAWLAPQRGDRAEVVAARDQRDANVVAGVVRGVDERGQLSLLRRWNLHIEREEDLLAEQVVARGIAVRARGAGERACREHENEQRALHPPARSRSSTLNGRPPAGAISKDIPQWPTITSAGAACA